MQKTNSSVTDRKGRAAIRYYYTVTGSTKSALAHKFLCSEGTITRILENGQKDRVDLDIYFLEGPVLKSLSEEQRSEYDRRLKDVECRKRERKLGYKEAFALQCALVVELGKKNQIIKRNEKTPPRTGGDEGTDEEHSQLSDSDEGKQPLPALSSEANRNDEKSKTRAINNKELSQGKDYEETKDIQCSPNVVNCAEADVVVSRNGKKRSLEMIEQEETPYTKANNSAFAQIFIVKTEPADEHAQDIAAIAAPSNNQHPRPTHMSSTENKGKTADMSGRSSPRKVARVDGQDSVSSRSSARRNQDHPSERRSSDQKGTAYEPLGSNPSHRGEDRNANLANDLPIKAAPTASQDTTPSNCPAQNEGDSAGQREANTESTSRQCQLSHDSSLRRRETPPSERPSNANTPTPPSPSIASVKIEEDGDFMSTFLSKLSLNLIGHTRKLCSLGVTNAKHLTAMAVLPRDKVQNWLRENTELTAFEILVFLCGIYSQNSG